MVFKRGEPPKNGRTYLLKFKGGIICTGSFRYGRLSEPQQDQAYWRCDCCGRFATPIAWAQCPPNKNMDETELMIAYNRTNREIEDIDNV